MRRRLSLLLLVLALTVRGLVPAGYMIASSAVDGTPSVVICTGHGLETVTLDPDGKPGKPKPARSDNGLCPYATSTPVAFAAAPVIVVERALAVAVIDFPASVGRGHAELHGGITSARGPPLLV
jgi:hypothetical protein